jgi:hypothetical protein
VGGPPSALFPAIGCRGPENHGRALAVPRRTGKPGGHLLRVLRASARGSWRRCGKAAPGQIRDSGGTEPGWG